VRLHHLALGARDVERLAAFYRDRLGLPEVGRHHEPDGKLRSVWLRLGEGVLMVEHVDGLPRQDEGLDCGIFLLALAFPPSGRAALEAELAGAGIRIEARTEHTAYFRDPEGNRVALSDHPLGNGGHKET
jgi:catechol 2,3-dioxygenase-like lactoylglutathione lyase family enzyme